jgi:hypothetical protein
LFEEGIFMRKALIPMLASLILCVVATAALIATNARAQGARKPVVALVGSSALFAQNAPLPAAGQDMRAAEMGQPMKDFCEDRYAREVGHMAYLETRLELTETERPLFAHWKQVMLDIAGRRAADCSQRMSLADQERADPVARMSREEDMLKKRLADLDAERPVFASFYQALTPEQRELLSPSSFFRRDRDRSFGRPRVERQVPPPPPAQ